MPDVIYDTYNIDSDPPQLPVIFQVSFPSEFWIVANASPTSQVITTKPPGVANVQAYQDIAGVRYYVSDWSWELHIKVSKYNFMRSAGAAVILSTSPTFFDPKSHGVKSIWDHNGSEMGLIVSGNDRTFVYVTPKASLAGLIHPGDTLFHGNVSGKSYIGEAHRFDAGMAPVDYQVAGPIMNNDERVELRGQMPIRDSTGSIIKYQSETLIFDWRRDL